MLAGLVLLAAAAGSGLAVGPAAGQENTATTVTASPASPSIYGQTVTLTATVSSVPAGGTPDGTVVFTDGVGGPSLGTATLGAGGVATLPVSTLSGGAHTISASYSGAANFLTSAGTLAYTVNKAATAVTLTSPTPDPSGFGSQVKLVASVAVTAGAGSPDGTLTFFDGATALGTTNVSAGTAIVASGSIAAGARSITAVYNGSTNFTGATSAPLSRTVEKAASTTTVETSDGSLGSAGRSVLLTATVKSGSGIPSGTVTFTDGAGGPSFGTATLDEDGFAKLPAQGLSLGAHTILATYSGTANVLGSTGSLAFTVGKGSATALVTTNPASPSLVGQPVTFTVSVEGGLGAPSGQVVLKDGAATLASAALTAVYNRTVATAIAAPSSNPDASATNLNTDMICLVTEAGGLKCWGKNQYGLLGEFSFNRPFPVDVPSLRSGVKAVALGPYHGCALMVSGGVKCWGDNQYGQLGIGTGGGSRTTPVDVVGLSSGVTAIAVGVWNTCAITAAGGLKCWGDNRSGQIGDGTTLQFNAPEDVFGLTSGVESVSASRHNTCAIIKATGGLKCWGSNEHGQVGDGTLLQRNTPVDVVGLTSGVASVSLAAYRACAVTTDGAAKCWGQNVSGSLGDGTTTDRSTPVQVVGLTSGVASMALGGSHTCALTTSGAVKCWGDNPYGQVGDGTSGVNRLTPVSVVSLDSGVKAIAARERGSFALTTDGVVQSWGSGGNALGSVLETGRLVPGEVERLLGGRSTATMTITGLAAGVRSVTAVYEGDAGRTGVTSPVLTYTVNKGATTTALGASVASATFGSPVTLTATVGVVAPASATPSGVVTFFRAGNVSIGTAAVSAGKAVLATTALPVGANAITARYDVAGADPRLLTSTSAGVAVTVTKGTSTSVLTASKNPVPLGSAVTLTATVGTGATGNVVFRNGATTLATVALTNGAASTSFTPSVAGTLSLTAAYAGDANRNASTSAALKLVVFASCKDAFASALPVASANASVFGTTVGATGETGEPNHAGNSGALNSVWCTWTAPAAGQVTIDTTGSSFDTTLGVYTGTSVSALTKVAANDNIGPGNTRSRVAFAVTAGKAYRIAIDGVSATGNYVLNIALAPPGPVTFASVLPTARSIRTGATATAFATMINTGTPTATACSLALPPGFPASFSYQITNAANAPTGTPNTPKDIASGKAQGFFFAVTPLVDLNSSELAIVFDCTNTPVTTTVPGLNTLLLSASSTPSPDLISIGSTQSGDGIANIPGKTGATAFGAATVNIGAAGTITASVDDNGRGLALIARLCVTNPTSGACVNPATPAATATFNLAANASATVAVFITGRGNVPFDPGANRIFLRFKTADGVTRGATSVAVRTQ